MKRFGPDLALFSDLSISNARRWRTAGESLICKINDIGALESEDSRARHPYVAGLLQEACVGLGLCP